MDRSGEKCRDHRSGLGVTGQAGEVLHGRRIAQGQLRARLQLGRRRAVGELGPGVRAAAEVSARIVCVEADYRRHRGHLHVERAAGRPDDRHAASKGRTGHPRHRAQGTAQARGEHGVGGPDGTRPDGKRSCVTDPTPTTPRIVLHTGKGGVGKTTISAATAVAVAHRGRRTLLLSTDPAHSIGDVLGVPIGAEPTAVGTNLWAAQVDTRGRLEQGWSAIRDYLTGLLAARGMAEVQAEELTVLPGAEEIIALLEVHRWAVDGRFDAVLVDCAPSGETLRLLALPETIAFYADRLMGAPRRLLRTLAASLSGGAMGGGSGQVHDALGDLLDRLTAARTLLTDPTHSDIRIVITAERVVIAEARRLLTALYLYGYPVGGVVVNRLLPDEIGDGFLAARRNAEASALHLVNESFAGLRTYRLPLAAHEPIGVPALAALGEQLYGTE